MVGAAGVGYKMDKELGALGVQTVADLRSMDRPLLTKHFGERTAAFLQLACRGRVSPPIFLMVHIAAAPCQACGCDMPASATEGADSPTPRHQLSCGGRAGMGRLVCPHLS